KREPEAALDAGANIELTDLKIQAVAMRIIANLDGRTLENGVLGIVGSRKSRTESRFRLIAIGYYGPQLIVRNLNNAAPREKIGNAAHKLAAVHITDDPGASK